MLFLRSVVGVVVVDLFGGADDDILMAESWDESACIPVPVPVPALSASRLSRAVSGGMACRSRSVSCSSVNALLPMTGARVRKLFLLFRSGIADEKGSEGLLEE